MDQRHRPLIALERKRNQNQFPRKTISGGARRARPRAFIHGAEPRAIRGAGCTQRVGSSVIEQSAINETSPHHARELAAGVCVVS